MKNVLIMCNAGMSSSLIAKKATEFFDNSNKDINVEATTVMEGEEIIKNGDYDLYLISPQMRMHLKKFEEVGKDNNKKVEQIPFNAYAPTQSGVKNLTDIILEALK
ncbi:MAG: PTS cellobiose transporter subunit IIB [Peptoniphilaceae bacterium]|nr:PTS cellobiose transporter subunit IIB [Peptoniphilaceae bacterium]MDY6018093.1 PTS cellobiose transporter subunit IIB [Anaerococcus sp.]